MNTINRSVRGNRGTWVGAALLLSIVAGGCAGSRDQKLASLIDQGEYARAGERAVSELAGEKTYRVRRLNQAQQLLCADGRPEAAEPYAFEAFEILRTRGMNADQTVITLGPDKTCKGEPFEQAMTYSYTAINQMLLGKWDQARAASASSLFLLKEFQDAEKPANASSLDHAAIAATAVMKEQNGNAAWLDNGYQPVETNFALGYALHGLASLALNRTDEAADNFRKASQYNPGFTATAQSLLAGRDNTVFIIDYGRGPEKQAYGHHDCFARFVPRTPSADEPATIAINEALAGRFPPVQDLNTLATDYRWTSLDDVRLARAILGDALVAGGAAAVAYGVSNDNTAATIGGGIAVAAGGLQIVNAHADTTQDESLPQRVYMAPVNISRADSRVEIMIGGQQGGRIVLTDVDPPGAGQRMRVHYVRLAPGGGSWQASGRTLYANDRTNAPIAGDDLPYILGGRCVRTPTQDVLDRYRAAGWLRDLSLEDLKNLYREEGIDIDSDHGGLHVLEGGTSLVAPRAGTAGYARLFGQEHPPYRPRSLRVSALADQVSAVLAARGPASERISSR